MSDTRIELVQRREQLLHLLEEVDEKIASLDDEETAKLGYRVGEILHTTPGFMTAIRQAMPHIASVPQRWVLVRATPTQVSIMPEMGQGVAWVVPMPTAELLLRMERR